MNINHIKITGALVLALASSVSMSAQSLPVDLNAQKIDLGWGVERSQFLSTASTSTISGDELRQTSASNLADALHAKLLGLTAIQNGGFVGDETSPWLTIRGYKTISDESILILVDGYERPINRLSLDEVESVTVLKDAAALALFGHEAINGAIYVKTKRGAEGKIQIKASYARKFTFDPEFAKMVDGDTYAAAQNIASVNDTGQARYTQAELDLYADGSDPFYYPNVDWKKEALRKSGFENHAALTISGGDEKVKYYTMMDYIGAHGMLKGTQQDIYNSQLKYSKANIRANVDFKISKTTKMSVNVLGIFLETSRPNQASADGVASQLYSTPANAFPIKTTNGLWGGNETYGQFGNPVASIQGTGFAKTHQRQLWADARLTQDLGFWVKGLSVSMEAGYDNASITNEYRSKGYKYGFDRYTGAVGDKNNVEVVSYGNEQSKLTFSDNVGSQWRIANAALGAHYNTRFRSEDNFSASLIYNLKGEVRDGRYNTFNRINWMGSFHYDLKRKYIADLVLAANGSNRSYPAKWGFSPTLSLGYIFADRAEGLFNYGKVRASGGILHTDYVPANGIWLASWDASNGSFNYGTNFSTGWGQFLQSFPTTKFQQERSLTSNLGVELRFFNALDITAEAFYTKRDHILLPAALENSYIVGIPSAYSDVGGVKSYGVEFGARFGKKIGKDLTLNAAAMVSWGRNEVTDFIGNPLFPGTDYVGQRVQAAYGLESIGFFSDEADIANSPTQEFGPVYPGDIKYKDQNGDGVVNEYDYVPFGKSNYLPELNYGFSFGAEWRGIGLNATFQGAANYFQNLRSAGPIWGGLANNGNLSIDYFNNSWDVVADKSKARFPRLSTRESTNNNKPSTTWMKDLSFFKLRYCELYYNLPAELVSKIRLGGVKVFVQGQNLWGTDNVEAMDAELLSNRFPTVKAVNLGMSVTF